MNWIYELLNRAGLVTELAGPARLVEIICFIIAIWCTAVMFSVGRYLMQHLLAVFDPQWRRHLPFSWASSLDTFPRFTRTSTYASWVVNPRLFGRSLPQVRNHNFAAEVSPRVRRFCTLYMIHLIGFVFSVFMVIALQFIAYFRG